jgi:hypothetical protein
MRRRFMSGPCLVSAGWAGLSEERMIS